MSRFFRMNDSDKNHILKDQIELLLLKLSALCFLFCMAKTCWFVGLLLMKLERSVKEILFLVVLKQFFFYLHSVKIQNVASSLVFYPQFQKKKKQECKYCGFSSVQSHIKTTTKQSKSGLNLLTIFVLAISGNHNDKKHRGAKFVEVH